MATLASRWSTFLSVNQNTMNIQSCSQYINQQPESKIAYQVSRLPRYVSFSLRTLSLDLQLMSKLLRKSAILLMLPVMSSMYSLFTQSAWKMWCEFKWFQRNWKSQKDIKEILHSTHSNPGIGLFSFLTWVWRCRLSLCAWVVARDILWRVCSLISYRISNIEILLSQNFCCLDYWMTKPRNAAYYYNIIISSSSRLL